MHSRRTVSSLVAVALAAGLACSTGGTNRVATDDAPNILFILTDDHRADALGFLGHPFLETPHLDRLAAEGVHFSNAFVTTSLCSPSRASILTGLYAHNHRVTDNYHPVDPDLVFFPQDLQEGGYETAFVGKWHMGDEDDPQRGFDHWMAFRGQGTYYPDGHGTSRVVPQTRYDGFNVNGERRRAQEGYITDELTDLAIEWLGTRSAPGKPFFLYVSHKAVHSDFVPRDEQKDLYQDADWNPPPTLLDSPASRAGKPSWVVNQRNSRHGADYGYNLDTFDLDFYYKRYCASLVPVDDSVGRLTDYLEETGQLGDTLIVYMGDNGFQFGEHGLIDKRTAYEPSIRVPLIMKYPDGLEPGRTVERVVANIDIAPTLLEVAGLSTPDRMDGRSFWPSALGKAQEWDDELLYEYYWEWNYPQTPTVHALRTDRYKYIRYHGIWDSDELYDLESDPHEQRNLIRDPDQGERVASLKARLFEKLAESGGHDIPLLPDRGRQFYNRHPDKAAEAPFPQWYYDEMVPVKE